MKLLFAILAHENPTQVEWLVEGLAAHCPKSGAVLFNGGTDDWAADLDIEEVGHQPLTWGHLAPFHYLSMRAVAGRDFDALVTVDYDCGILKPGLEEQLGPLLDRFAYLAPRFHTAEPWTAEDPDRHVWAWWSYWQPILGAPRPYAVFNPVQVFRRDLVDRFVADPQMPTILAAAARAHVDCLEEVIYPTRAVAYGLPTTTFPGDHALSEHRWDAAELELHMADPRVCLVHKVTEPWQRVAIDRLQGREPDAGEAAHRLAERPMFPPMRRRAILKVLASMTARNARGVLAGP